MILGSTAVSVYALTFGTLAPVLGPWVACILCWVVGVLLASTPSYLFLRWRAGLAHRQRLHDADNIVLTTAGIGQDAEELYTKTVV